MTPIEAKAILIKQYVRTVGSMPQEGGWLLSEASLTQLADVVNHYGTEKEFLEDQMCAFLLRTGASLGKHPRTKFFADTYLFAESSLEYLTKYRDNLRFIINAASSHETFGGMVRADIISGETQWLEGSLSYGPPDPTSVRPPVWWILASVTMRRFKYADIPECWLEGSAPCLSAMLRHKPKHEILIYEKGRLAASKELKALLEESTIVGIEEATFGWVQQHKVAFVAKDADEWQLLGSNEDFISRLREAILVTTPLSDRDKRLRKVVCDHAKTLGMEVLPTQSWKAAKDASEPDSEPSSGSKPIDGINVADLVAGFQRGSTLAGLNNQEDE